MTFRHQFRSGGSVRSSRSISGSNAIMPADGSASSLVRSSSNGISSSLSSSGINSRGASQQCVKKPLWIHNNSSAFPPRVARWPRQLVGRIGFPPHPRPDATRCSHDSRATATTSSKLLSRSPRESLSVTRTREPRHLPGFGSKVTMGWSSHRTRFLVDRRSPGSGPKRNRWRPSDRSTVSRSMKIRSIRSRRNREAFE